MIRKSKRGEVLGDPNFGAPRHGFVHDDDVDRMGSDDHERCRGDEVERVIDGRKFRVKDIDRLFLPKIGIKSPDTGDDFLGLGLA